MVMLPVSGGYQRFIEIADDPCMSHVSSAELLKVPIVYV